MWNGGFLCVWAFIIRVWPIDSTMGTVHRVRAHNRGKSGRIWFCPCFLLKLRLDQAQTWCVWICLCLLLWLDPFLSISWCNIVSGYLWLFRLATDWACPAESTRHQPTNHPPIIEMWPGHLSWWWWSRHHTHTRTNERRDQVRRSNINVPNGSVQFGYCVLRCSRVVVVVEQHARALIYGLLTRRTGHSKRNCNSVIHWFCMILSVLSAPCPCPGNLVLVHIDDTRNGRRMMKILLREWKGGLSPFRARSQPRIFINQEAGNWDMVDNGLTVSAIGCAKMETMFHWALRSGKGEGGL